MKDGPPTEQFYSVFFTNDRMGLNEKKNRPVNTSIIRSQNQVCGVLTTRREAAESLVPTQPTRHVASLASRMQAKQESIHRR